MKLNGILLSVLCLLPLALTGRADDKSLPAPPTLPSVTGQGSADPGSSTSSTVNAKATVSIEMGGKRITREINIKDGDITVSKSSLRAAPATGPVTWLGAATDAISPATAARLSLEEGSGLLVRHVVPESPAARAGLEINDVLVKMDDQFLVNPEQLGSLIRRRKAGETVSLSYYRQGRLTTMTAMLEAHTVDVAETAAPDVLELGNGDLKVADLLKSIDKNGSRMLRQDIVLGADGKVKPLDAELKQSMAEALKKTVKEMTGSADEATMKKLQKALEKSEHEDEDSAPEKK